MRLPRPALRPLALAAVILPVLAVAPAQARTEATASKRPSAVIVKRGLTKTWALDYNNSVDKVTLTFRSLQLLPTRRAVPYRDFVEPGKWVTPVASVFDQKTITMSPNILTGQTDRTCRIYRVNFTGIFWRGDFGWTYKNRNVKTKRIMDSRDPALPDC
jgi:hypothetical protein